MQNLRYLYRPREQKVDRIITSLKVIYKEISIYIHNGLFVCSKEFVVRNIALQYELPNPSAILEVYSNVTNIIFACQHNKEQYSNNFMLIFIFKFIIQR